MAEILISLTIIGIIAAIMLPVLIGNFNDRLWDAQRRALHARMSQAIKLMPSVRGYGAEDYSITWTPGDCPQEGSRCNDTVTINNDNTAMSFVVNGLSKVMKLRNICDHNHLIDCGLVSSFRAPNNDVITRPDKLSNLSEMFYQRLYKGNNPNLLGHSEITIPNGTGMDSYAAGVETENGESLLVLYNHQCLPAPDKQTVRFLIKEYKKSNWTEPFYKWLQHQSGVWSNFFIQSQMCVNFIYDLNGKKGPNKIYKDMGFITVMYPTDSDIVAPIFMAKKVRNPEDSSQTTMRYDLAARACELADENSRVASLNEAIAHTINHHMVAAGNGVVTNWGSADAHIDEEYAWKAGEAHGWVFPASKTGEHGVNCVKK